MIAVWPTSWTKKLSSRSTTIGTTTVLRFLELEPTYLYPPIVLFFLKSHKYSIPCEAIIIAEIGPRQCQYSGSVNMTKKGHTKMTLC